MKTITKRISLAYLFAFAGIFSIPASAMDLYGEVGIETNSVGASDVTDAQSGLKASFSSASLETLVFRGAWQATPRFSLGSEVFAGIRSKDASVVLTHPMIMSERRLSFSQEIQYGGGVFVRGIWPVASQFDLYGNIGGQYTRVKTGFNDSMNPSVRTSENSLYGSAGVTYNLSRDRWLNLGYKRIDNISVNSISLAVGFGF